MSDNDEFKQQYSIGDEANGYVLTPEGWKPIPPSSDDATQTVPTTPTMPISTSENTGANPQYRIGDVANGYVLTPQGWQPAGQAPAYGQGYAGAPGSPGSPGSPGGPGGSGGQGSPPSRRGLYIALAIAAVVILGVAAAGTYAWVSLQNTVASPKSPTPTSRTTTRSTTSPTSRPTTTRPTTPSTSSTSSTSSPAAATKTFTFGESSTLTLKNAPAGEIKVDKPVAFDPLTSADTPENGQLVYVPVTVKVTGQSSVDISDFDFVAILPSGEKVDSAFVDLPKDAPAELDDTVKPGQTVTGSVAFDVPKGAALTIGYQPDSQVLGTWSG